MRLSGRPHNPDPSAQVSDEIGLFIQISKPKPHSAILKCIHRSVGEPFDSRSGRTFVIDRFHTTPLVEEVASGHRTPRLVPSHHSTSRDDIQCLHERKSFFRTDQRESIR